jgi:hypothetical protein
MVRPVRSYFNHVNGSELKFSTLSGTLASGAVGSVAKAEGWRDPNEHPPPHTGDTEGHNLDTTSAPRHSQLPSASFIAAVPIEGFSENPK